MLWKAIRGQNNIAKMCSMQNAFELLFAGQNKRKKAPNLRNNILTEQRHFTVIQLYVILKTPKYVVEVCYIIWAVLTANMALGNERVVYMYSKNLLTECNRLPTFKNRVSSTIPLLIPKMLLSN